MGYMKYIGYFFKSKIRYLWNRGGKMEKEFQGVVERIGRQGLYGVVFRALMKLENQAQIYYVDGEDPKMVKEKLRGLKMGDTVILRCELLDHDGGEYRIVEMRKIGDADKT